ncbi:hypothetical protein EYZ11_012467 [Aspergillus tanneri]|uniref:Yeast cell wall synthesis Kre9/Knh1-like N-terminal domain-containing protein n=1 Tax=Aspergillus tanneri TaxID=1220188 RepID=A0A4S3J0F5_9EURO|nr:uncharacterized protein ATNIH1004_009236 [Aspergillus tanneri]KAA8645025.1 hypothetical protein ATNIH1004_009236 [Aspergillus tanneri]THC88085.1 hypothetical protein EYZ11_012467 [Aspergillus tanneri]
MRLSLASSLLPLAVSVGALSVTSPEKGADIDASGSFTVKWSSVDTDPSTFDLYLVNNAVYPSVEKKIASNIDTSKGSYTVDGISGLTDGKGYQISLLSNSGRNTGILAQSEQFKVAGGSESSSTSTSASASSFSASTGSSSTRTSVPTGTSTGTLSKATKTSSITSAKSSSTSYSSATASSTGAAANGTTSGSSPNSTGAGVILTAPVTAAAGLLAGVLALNL